MCIVSLATEVPRPEISCVSVGDKFVIIVLTGIPTRAGLCHQLLLTAPYIVSTHLSDIPITILGLSEFSSALTVLAFAELAEFSLEKQISKGTFSFIQQIFSD